MYKLISEEPYKLTDKVLSGLWGHGVVFDLNIMGGSSFKQVRIYL